MAMSFPSSLFAMFMLMNSSAAIDQSVIVDGSGALLAPKVVPPACSPGVCSVGKWISYRSGVTRADCKKECEAGRVKEALSNGPIEKIYALQSNGRFMDVIGGPMTPSLDRTVSQIKYPSTGGYWSGYGAIRLRDHFYVVWEGTVTIKTAGTYYFWTTSDDGSQMFIGGKRVVYNPGWHGMQFREGKVTLTSGDHSFKAEMFEGGGGAGMECYWGGSPNTRSKQLMKVGHPFKTAVSEKAYSFRQNGHFRTKFMTPTITPNKIRRVDQINYPIADPTSAGWGFPGFRNYFYVRWEGFINITAAGTYEFELTSKHGSRLFINGKKVTASPQGWHDWTTVKHSGDVVLGSGMHSFWIELYQGKHKAGIEFKYRPQGKGSTFQNVPKTVLFGDKNPTNKYRLSNAPWNREGGCEAFSFTSGGECILYTKCDAVSDTVQDVCGDDVGGTVGFETCKYAPFSMAGVILQQKKR